MPSYLGLVDRPCKVWGCETRFFSGWLFQWYVQNFEKKSNDMKMINSFMVRDIIQWIFGLSSDLEVAIDQPNYSWLASLVIWKALVSFPRLLGKVTPKMWQNWLSIVLLGFYCSISRKPMVLWTKWQTTSAKFWHMHGEMEFCPGYIGGAG